MNFKDIDRIVSRHFKIKPDKMHSNAHHDKIILARAAAIKLNHDLLNISFNKLCKLYERKSHNTAGNAYRNACNMYETNKSFKISYDKAHNEAVKYMDEWSPRKQRYNLHYRLRDKGISVHTKQRTVSITAKQEDLLNSSGQVKKLLQQHNYSIQYAIL